ncbi:UbiA family prenyltransferase [Streptomyces sp. E11-3]|uniref:UbiA family prenyltransferase n=1 Tax=Streptomyces sp. E11-3 TaxID=3110112 RepID=UPI003981326C
MQDAINTINTTKESDPSTRTATRPSELRAPSAPGVPAVASLPKTLALCLRESRPSVQIVFLLRFTVAFLMSARISGAGLTAFAPAACAWGTATSYVYLVNGVHDAPEDRMNNNGRPISSGELPLARARLVSWVLAASALTVAAVSGGWVLPALVAAQLICGYAYSAPHLALKRRTSTAVLDILFLGGLTFAAGWLSGGAAGELLPVLAFGGAMTLWMGAVGALVKDLSDVRGDTAAGRRTALVRWGERRARTVCAITPVMVGLAYTATAVVAAPRLLPSALPLLAGALVTARLVRVTSSDEPRSRSRLPYRAFMVTQYGACLAQLGAELVALRVAG